jgi:hypothetical protein
LVQSFEGALLEPIRLGVEVALVQAAKYTGYQRTEEAGKQK